MNTIEKIKTVAAKAALTVEEYGVWGVIKGIRLVAPEGHLFACNNHPHYYLLTMGADAAGNGLNDEYLVAMTEMCIKGGFRKMYEEEIKLYFVNR